MRTEVGSGSRTVIGEQQHLKETQMKRSIEKEWEKISRNIKDNKENKVVKRRDCFLNEGIICRGDDALWSSQE